MSNQDKARTYCDIGILLEEAGRQYQTVQTMPPGERSRLMHAIEDELFESQIRVARHYDLMLEAGWLETQWAQAKAKRATNPVTTQ